MGLDDRTFYGQHEDEVILCEIRPHWTRKSLAVLYGMFYGLSVFQIIVFFDKFPRLESDYVVTAAIITGLIVNLLVTGWLWYCANLARAFVTDRRLIRLEAAFPIFINRRTLFWNEVLKVKGYAPNVIFRLMRVGTLALQPVMAQSGQEDVKLHYVYYFGDLANYIDKILFTYKTKPEDVKEIRPFVARPSGERY